MSKPIEEAPFEIYLKILKGEGYAEEAELSEAFYLELLTSIDLGDGKHFTKEQVMKTPFKNIVAAAEKILQTAQQEIQQNIMPVASFSGYMMKGKGADKLTADELSRLMMRQLQLHEEEKMRLAMR